MNLRLRTPRSRWIASAALATATALTLAACGSSTATTPGQAGASFSPSAATSSQGGPAASATHNDADVAFATDMIPHHGQAVDMADLALGRATDPTVKQLAAAVKSAQDPEIATMSGWLRQWGQPVPSATGEHGMSHVGTSGRQMPGMMSDDELKQLGSASGAAFDRMWLQMMVAHHRGAVATAQTELSSGSSPDAKRLAQAVIDTQTTEIATMTSRMGMMGG